MKYIAILSVLVLIVALVGVGYLYMNANIAVEAVIVIATDALSQEALVGVFLDLQQVRDLDDSVVIMLGIALSQGLAIHDILDHCHSRSSQPFFSILVLVI